MTEPEIDVKAIRLAHHLTQQGLAEAAGVNLSTVWRWENGKAPKGTARAFLLKLRDEAPSVQGPN